MNKLYMNKELYSVNDITAAADAYRNLAKIDVADGGTYRIVIFDQCRFDPVRVMKEFENYVIYLTYKSRYHGNHFDS